ncbi:hypothetical protein MJO29_013967 [Puccinia striiformis f. sp. tritici]|uniref:Uncharacterized protein n=1 Tax=Puccinia striiformis f. sp. tritici PST-78 TaxID=1165861 RepID=A0A0L0W4A1_9BASI|nr:hypothetical protein Pst134EA_026652 [Puccinia striiformis f. sp. tritici]KAI9626230.1 hypothetical protein KEM48_010480 [Puccinia striiformis f. sp. tritici PST-130]KNF06281.1 hypothetical protein PSTG_00787 [Puccinia striiformis f. sp. tritici PST-78]KAH9442859.1 hypothetical protein Pst134EB_027211 [Puccinia striiformis f. sp. tritici]KAH9449940.1 hypothetical protein Pst134EA_026652 [Puccinia striiformis f. sp. tritici]KAI7939231.1 hypothetical protein MJO29_013967 [Puccinia striiformis
MNASLKLIILSLKSYIYLSNRTRARNIKKKKILIGLIISLSTIQNIQQTYELLKTHQTTIKNNQVHDNDLRSILESSADTIEIIINLLDNLVLLLPIIIKNHKLLLSTTINLFNLIFNILKYAISSFVKAQLWTLGNRTKHDLTHTSQLIKRHKLASIHPPPSENDDDESTVVPHPTRKSIAKDDVNSLISDNKNRKLVLKSCKKSLNKIRFNRIIYCIDGLVSAYDLLQLKFCSRVTRLLIEWITTLLEFMEPYSCSTALSFLSF